MMPIEMEIGRREGVTFAINSLGNTANKKSAEKSLFVDFLRFILIAAARRLSNKFPSKPRRSRYTKCIKEKERRLCILLASSSKSIC